MNKGLDLIQRRQAETIDGYPTGNVYIDLTYEELAELEKELKALELVKEIWRISFFDEEQRITIDDCYSMIFHDKEKYDLLKEALS